MKIKPTHIDIVIGFKDAVARDAFDAEVSKAGWADPMTLKFAGHEFHFRVGMCGATQRQKNPVFVIGACEPEHRKAEIAKLR